MKILWIFFRFYRYRRKYNTNTILFYHEEPMLSFVFSNRHIQKPPSSIIFPYCEGDFCILQIIHIFLCFCHIFLCFCQLFSQFFTLLQSFVIRHFIAYHTIACQLDSCIFASFFPASHPFSISPAIRAKQRNLLPTK